MKRFDKGYFYHRLVSSLATAAAMAFIVVEAFFDTVASNFSMVATVAGIVFAVVYVSSVILAWFFVKTSGYELTKNEIKCKRGVFFRKTSSLEYAKIHAVNKKQTLFQRIFGIAVLTIDSGATSNSDAAEIVIVEKSDTVDALISEIALRQEGKEVGDLSSEEYTSTHVDEANLYEFSSKLKWIYSAISTFAVVLVVVILVVMALITVFAIKPFLNITAQNSLMKIFFAALIGTLGSLVLMSIFSLIGALLTSFVGFYGFKITRSGDDLSISYGLFQKNTNTFKLKRIKAVKIVQSPFRRIFGFATANLEVVGYTETRGDNQEQSAPIGIFLPIFKISEVEKTLSKILPEYIPVKRQERARSFFSFVLWSYLAVTIISLAAFGVASVILSALSASVATWAICGVAIALAWVILLVLVTISGALQYTNSGISIEDYRVSVYHGGLSKHCTVIRKKDIIAIEDITTPMRAEKGIYTYVLHFYTNSMTNTVKVRCLGSELSEKLCDLMKY